MDISRTGGTRPIAAVTTDPASSGEVDAPTLAAFKSGADALPKTVADPTESIAKRAAVLFAPSAAIEIAKDCNLLGTYEALITGIRKSTGVSAAALKSLRGQTLQVTKDTPLGFVGKAGDVSWPYNQSQGRSLGLHMSRTLLMRPTDGHAVVKVKGAGQAPDHPGQKTQKINDRPRPPIPYALIWDRGFWRTGTPQFGLQMDYADEEFRHMLTVHAVSMQVFGRPASAPTPIDVTRIDHVVINDEAMTLARARSDVSVWGNRHKYLAREQVDMFKRLRDVDPELVLSADSLDAFKAELAKTPSEAQLKLLHAHDVPTDDLDEATIDDRYAGLVLAETFGEQFALGQIVMVESGQVRNNIVQVWDDKMIAPDKKATLDRALEQTLANWGLAYKPPADKALGFEQHHQQALAPYAGVIMKRLKETLGEIGRMYGMVRAFGASADNGFHPKDIIGAQVTDWVDYEMPLPDAPPPPFSDLASWVGYMGGVDKNVECFAKLFRLDGASQKELQAHWRKTACAAAVKTAKAGLSGKLDKMLGPGQKEWSTWIQDEIAQATPGGTSLRDALAALKA